MNLAMILAERARRHPGRLALRFEGEDFSYGDFQAQVLRHASVLAALGIRPGDRVATQLGKRPESLFLHFATLALGAVALPLNMDYRAEELAYFLSDSGSRLLVTDGACLPGAREAAASLPRLELGLLEAEAPVGVHPWGRLLAEAGPVEPGYPGGSEDTAMLCYTSGTTGRSKGAMITHGNLLANAEALHRSWGWSEADRLLHLLPLFHVHGLNVAALGCLHAGAAMVMHQRFEPRRAWEALVAERCTILMAVPTIYQRLMNEWEALETKPDLGGMRLFVSGSAPLSEAQFERFARLTGFPILERYGMTETGMITTNPLDPAGRKARSVGYPLPGVDVRVVDAAGADSPPGEVGEVWVRGPNVCKGYWGMPDKTRESFTGDWFHTGDMGTLDPEDGGRLYLVGRAKELIIAGGFNVYPKEVEGVLEAHGAVREAAVVGLPDEDLGERVTAVVVLREGSPVTDEELVAHCREHLAAYKCPRRIVRVPELPRNAMGKLQKNLLVERFG
ncbi:MAG: AMP-binding protein [Acidobacteria bacterium]|nr:AMP-binding protein [Acidobacteriota bacterium]